MYIKKYWGNFIGGSDDSLNLVAFLEDQKKEEIPLSEIFTKIGLDKQNWDFRQTEGYPTSSRHPRMPISDRAAQFSPFAALAGHSAALAETARLTDRQIELSDDDKAVLDQ